MILLWLVPALVITIVVLVIVERRENEFDMVHHRERALGVLKEIHDGGVRVPNDGLRRTGWLVGAYYRRATDHLRGVQAGGEGRSANPPTPGEDPPSEVTVIP